MNQPAISSYTFLPWARQGLGLQLTQGHGDTSVKLRGSVPVNLKVSGDKVHGTGRQEAPQIDKAVQLYGPGDVIGIDPASIVRTEPRPNITNFESNFLAFVEFYDEDFCWRYTPAKASADGRHLRPWLTLLVLEDSEFSDLGTPSGHPLPAIRVTGSGVFPSEDKLWAWAHVHVDASLGGDPNNAVDQAGRLGATVRNDRDSAYSRLVSPRRLKANTGYYAFVVPSFETGRVAGLGLPLDDVGHATQSSWAVGRNTAPLHEYPVYHRWYFRTGSVGDFEYLVRLLKPRTVDPRVGHRDIDLLDPHAAVPEILGPGNDGVLRLGGALRAPLATLSDDDRQEYDDYEQWPGTYPHPYQTAMAAFVNLGADYGQMEVPNANSASRLPDIENDDDPLITPPLYSRWHSRTTRLQPPDQPPKQENKWVDELNLDPRHRSSAGFGTEVVRRGQESYMESAWQQVGKVLEGNSKIRYAQLARLATYVWYRRELKPVAAAGHAQLLALTAPVQRRVLSGGLTLSHQVKESTVPTALLGTTMRKALRPRARVDRLVGFTEELSAATLIDRVNSGEVSPAPPKQVPVDVPTGGELADRLPGGGLPEWLAALLRRTPGWRWILVAIALVLALLLLLISPVVGAVAAVVLVAGTLALARWLARRLARQDAADVLSAETRRPDSVDDLGTSSDFTVAEPGEAPRPTPGGPDSAEAVRFKQALRNLYAVDQAERTIELPSRKPLDLRRLAADTVSALDPGTTIPARVLGSIAIPARIKDAMVEDFGEVMVYPEIDDPMYKPLIGLSDEHFVPNLNLVEVNSITLLETNQEFIEAYLVGLNHEFARELLWREYPTDQRGSYFRQFWDVTGYLAAPGADPVQLREELRDIPELHTWSKDKDLGSFDHREQAGEEENEVVLVIRGELLKKYPDAVIYGHRAEWTSKSDGTPDKTKPRRLKEPPAGGDPGRTVVKTPLYEAKVDPDIYFFGFDLTAEEARGGKRDDGTDDPGWFFVIKERPGEPRFGLDLPQGAPQAAMNTWNQLAWSDVAVAEGAQLLPGSGRTISLVDPGAASDAKTQYDEDRRHQWRPDTTAAEIAYILYQVPVLMAVHAAEMLVKPEDDNA